ncbi:Sulfide-quinone reductase [Candidatus Calditenuaceae archaeon HR02]|nr:Sulfide-quinone reductase [Candidatus Calditenuaceae archaeon HR02]
MKRVVIIGAGTGGIILANALSKKLKAEMKGGRLEIVVFDGSESHVYQPGNIDIAFRGADPKIFRRPITQLLSREVRLFKRPVSRIELDNRAVIYDSGLKMDYDYLVVATGSVAAPETIPGLAEASLNFHRSQEDARRVWEALSTFRRGRIVVLTALPHKCPPSPVEAVFLIDELMRKKGIRDEVEIAYATPYTRAYPAHGIADVVEPEMEKRGITTYTLFNIDYVDPSTKKIYSLEREELAYDLLIAIPPHRGAEVVINSGIGGEEGWIPTDKRTLKIRGLDDAYAIGDATDIPISKSGVVAHLEAITTAESIASQIHGMGKVYLYNGRINCPLEMGGRRAVFVSGTYTRQPERQNPSIAKYLMKRLFNRLYWTMLSGALEPIFNIYLGPPYDVNEGAEGVEEVSRDRPV